MDPWTDEVLLELAMCFKLRKTSVLAKEQEISCTWVLECSNSSSVCVRFSKNQCIFRGSAMGVATFLENPSNTALVKQRIILIDHCRWKVLDLGNGRDDFKCCVYSVSFIYMSATLYKQPFVLFFLGQ